MSDKVSPRSAIPVRATRPRPPRIMPVIPEEPTVEAAADDEPQAKPKKAYEVGNGRPPVATRFKKGVCGNPKGRPKGARGYDAMVDEALNKKVEVRIDGKTRKVSQIEVGLMQLFKKAMSGHDKSILRVLELGKERERRKEERSNGQEAASGFAPLSDSERTMLAHLVRMEMLDERFAPEDVDVAMKIFGLDDPPGDTQPSVEPNDE